MVNNKLQKSSINNKVAIVLLTKNGNKRLERLLGSIYTQSPEISSEVIIIDSGSTDNTLSILKNFPVKLYRLKPEEFGHGKTRNFGARLANSEYIVYLTQDATPVNNSWLYSLILPMEQDQTVAGVYSRQIPYLDCNPIEKRDILTYFRNKRIIKSLQLRTDSKKRNRKIPIEKLILFSNVSSAYRKKILKNFPFNENIVMCEDQEWCKRALESGYKVVYEPKSVVIHSHNFSIKKLYKRNFDYGISFKEFITLDMNLVRLMLIVLKQTLGDWNYLRKSRLRLVSVLKWAFLAPFYRVAIHLGRYNGYKKHDYD